jgi:hypothetical protein
MTDLKVGSEADKVNVLANTSEVRQYNPDDPYDTEAEHAETSDFIFNTFFAWTGAGGTFSTWRERHVFLRGFRNGFGTELQGKFSECPSMWSDEGQYYDFGQEAGYVFRNAFIFLITGAVGTEVVMNSGTIINILTKLFGM